MLSAGVCQKRCFASVIFAVGLLSLPQRVFLSAVVVLAVLFGLSALPSFALLETFCFGGFTACNGSGRVSLMLSLLLSSLVLGYSLQGISFQTSILTA